MTIPSPIGDPFRAVFDGGVPERSAEAHEFAAARRVAPVTRQGRGGEPGRRREARSEDEAPSSQLQEAGSLCRRETPGRRRAPAATSLCSGYCRVSLPFPPAAPGLPVAAFYWSNCFSCFGNCLSRRPLKSLTERGAKGGSSGMA